MNEEEILSAEFAHNPYTFENDGMEVVGVYQKGFVEGAIWMREQLTKWLKEHSSEYINNYDGDVWIDIKELIEDINKL